MEEVELKPINMHWIGDPYGDCCVHGGVYLRLGTRVVSDGSDHEWAISTAAFNFLRSLFHDHNLFGEESLIPHCGFTMWLSEGQPDGLYIPNCDTGINWAIRKYGDRLIHEFPDGTAIETRRESWRNAVCGFADEVEVFFRTAWPKVIDDEIDKEGFQHFMNIWNRRRSDAELENAGPSNR